MFLVFEKGITEWKGGLAEARAILERDDYLYACFLESDPLIVLFPEIKPVKVRLIKDIAHDDTWLPEVPTLFLFATTTNISYTGGSHCFCKIGFPPLPKAWEDQRSPGEFKNAFSKLCSDTKRVLFYGQLEGGWEGDPRPSLRQRQLRLCRAAGLEPIQVKVESSYSHKLLDILQKENCFAALGLDGDCFSCFRDAEQSLACVPVIRVTSCSEAKALVNPWGTAWVVSEDQGDREAAIKRAAAEIGRDCKDGTIVRKLMEGRDLTERANERPYFFAILNSLTLDADFTIRLFKDGLDDPDSVLLGRAIGRAKVLDSQIRWNGKKLEVRGWSGKRYWKEGNSGVFEAYSWASKKRTNCVVVSPSVKGCTPVSGSYLGLSLEIKRGGEMPSDIVIKSWETGFGRLGIHGNLGYEGKTTGRNAISAHAPSRVCVDINRSVSLRGEINSDISANVAVEFIIHAGPQSINLGQATPGCPTKTIVLEPATDVELECAAPDIMRKHSVWISDTESITLNDAETRFATRAASLDPSIDGHEMLILTCSGREEMATRCLGTHLVTACRKPRRVVIVSMDEIRLPPLPPWVEIWDKKTAFQRLSAKGFSREVLEKAAVPPSFFIKYLIPRFCMGETVLVCDDDVLWLGPCNEMLEPTARLTFIEDPPGFYGNFSPQFFKTRGIASSPSAPFVCAGVYMMKGRPKITVEMASELVLKSNGGRYDEQGAVGMERHILGTTSLALAGPRYVGTSSKLTSQCQLLHMNGANIGLRSDRNLCLWGISKASGEPTPFNRSELLDKIGISGETCVEVGTYRGQFAETILSKNPSKLYLIDPWISQSPLIYPSNDYTSLNDVSSWDMIYADIERKFKPNPRVEIIRDLSLNAAERFHSQSVYMAYIDAIHTFESCFSDICTWFPKVRKGGWICGHDYCPHFPGVKKAVEAFCLLSGQRVQFVTADKGELPSWAIRRTT